MKKFFVCLLFVCAAILAVGNVHAQVATSGYDIVMRSETPSIDGNLSDAVWTGVPVINGEFRYP